MPDSPADKAAARLRENIRLTSQAGWIGITLGPAPDLIVNLYKRRKQHWPTAEIPQEIEGYAVRLWKTGVPRPCI